MTARSLKVFSELRDLEIVDSQGELCGIADEVEFAGKPGETLRIVAVLVGPGALPRRLPPGLGPIVRWLAGEAIVRVPWEAVAHVTSRITLNRTADELGLAATDRRLAPILAKLPQV